MITFVLTSLVLFYPELRRPGRRHPGYPTRIVILRERNESKDLSASPLAPSSLPTHHSPLATDLCPFVFNILRTLLHSRNSQLLSLQSLPHSLPKTPGGGIPLA